MKSDPSMICAATIVIGLSLSATSALAQTAATAAPCTLPPSERQACETDVSPVTAGGEQLKDGHGTGFVALGWRDRKPREPSRLALSVWDGPSINPYFSMTKADLRGLQAEQDRQIPGQPVRGR